MPSTNDIFIAANCIPTPTLSCMHSGHYSNAIILPWPSGHKEVHLLEYLLSDLAPVSCHLSTSMIVMQQRTPMSLDASMLCPCFKDSDMDTSHLPSLHLVFTEDEIVFAYTSPKHKLGISMTFEMCSGIIGTYCWSARRAFSCH